MLPSNVVSTFWESLYCVPDSLLVTAAKRSSRVLAIEWGPTVWSHENGQNPVRKVWLEIEEDLGRKVTGSKLGAREDSSLWNLR